MTNPMLRRVAAHQLFEHKDGSLKLLGIYGVLWPAMSMALLHRLLEDNFDKKKVQDIFYTVGETQGYHATMWGTKKAGIPLEGNELKILKETINHGEMTGLGRSELVFCKTSSKHVAKTVDNDMVAMHYKKMFEDKAINDYQRGLFGGTLKFLFGEEMVVASKQISPTRWRFDALPLDQAKENEEFKEFIVDPLNVEATKEFTLRKYIS